MMRGSKHGWAMALGLGVVGLGVAVSGMTGCRVSEGKGAHKDVSIDTPLGGLNVKTDPTAVLGKVGIPAYPGAQALVESADDKHAADVNLSFGGFKLQVLATGLVTSDSPAQVEAFYRKALAQYSDVIACRNDRPVGTPERTGMGLTCDEDKNVKTVHVNDNERDELELKAGSRRRQHIVSVKQQADGKTRMELVSLELPHGDGDDN